MSDSTTYTSGVGYRLGPDRVQVVLGGHLGVQITEVPELTEEDEDRVVVDTKTSATGLAVVHAGLEIYLDRGVAFTLDLSGRTRFERLRSGSLFGLAATAGIATAF